MATSSASCCFKMARLLATALIIIGALFIVFGFAERVIGGFYWTGYSFFGIWMGIWVCITGFLGIPGTSKERTSRNKTFAGVFMGFSITSAVFGVAVIICYGVALISYAFAEADYQHGRSPYRTERAVAIIMMILGFAEFVIGIWAASCCCYLIGCDCCGTTDTGQQDVQMVYSANPNVPNSGGYMMTQGPGGVPMAVPVQRGGGVIAVRLPPYEAVGSYPQVVPVSWAQTQMVHVSASSGAIGSNPQSVQGVSTSDVAMEADELLLVQMPPSGAMGSYPQVEPMSGPTRGEPQSVQGVASSDVAMEADELLLVQMPPSGAMGSYSQVEPVFGATRGEPQSVQGVSTSDVVMEADELLLVQMPSDQLGQYRVMSYV